MFLTFLKLCVTGRPGGKQILPLHHTDAYHIHVTGTVEVGLDHATEAVFLKAPIEASVFSVLFGRQSWCGFCLRIRESVFASWEVGTALSL